MSSLSSFVGISENGRSGFRVLLLPPRCIFSKNRNLKYELEIIKKIIYYKKMHIFIRLYIQITWTFINNYHSHILHFGFDYLYGLYNLFSSLLIPKLHASSTLLRLKPFVTFTLKDAIIRLLTLLEIGNHLYYAFTNSTILKMIKL